MSLEGNATAEVVLRGTINNLDTLVFDAYDIAVKHGFSGTEEEWLASLKGADGKDGVDGKDGEKGDKGDTGDARDAVLYVPQTLTAEQKAQARANIGAAQSVPTPIIDTELDATSGNAVANSAVAKEFVNLNKKADAVVNDGMLHITTTWENIYIYGDGSSASNPQVITSGKITDKAIKIECPQGYRFVRRFYNSFDAVVKADSGWITETTVTNLDEYAYVRLCVQKVTGQNIVADEAIPLYKYTLSAINKERIDAVEADVDAVREDVSAISAEIIVLNDEVAKASQSNNLIKAGKNLYNPDDPTAIKGGYDRGGNYVQTSAYNQTGLIEVVPGENYTASYKSGFVCWYKEDKTFLLETDSGTFSRQGYVTAPADAKYVRFVYLVGQEATFQAEKGTTSTSYEPYYTALDKQNFLNKGAVKLVSYGDSIVERNKWQPFLVDNYGFEHTNLGIGSTTVAYRSDIEANTPCMVNTNRIEAIKTADPDLIVIMGGTNDTHLGVTMGDETQLSTALASKDKTTFYGAYSFLLETLLTWKPTLGVILMTPMQSNWAVANNYDDYAEAIRKIAHYFAVPVADTNRMSGISHFNATTYTDDGLHPNDNGGRVIANIVAERINGMYLI